MHQLKVLILGPTLFSTTLNELKPYLKFNFVEENNSSDFDVILFHEDALKDKDDNKIVSKSPSLKICASSKKKTFNNYDAFLKLPSSLEEINAIVESVAAKQIFSKNSSIEIKNYILNKNEKKLIKSNRWVFITEKEVLLIELLFKEQKPLSKNFILKKIWNYSENADTHTVETHIYRLRKKINEKFNDNNFILNSGTGYSI